MKSLMLTVLIALTSVAAAAQLSDYKGYKDPAPLFPFRREFF